MTGRETDDVLDMIDGVLDEHELTPWDAPDAMRWAPPEMQPDPEPRQACDCEECSPGGFAAAIRRYFEEALEGAWVDVERVMLGSGARRDLRGILNIDVSTPTPRERAEGALAGWQQQIADRVVLHTDERVPPGTAFFVGVDPSVDPVQTAIAHFAVDEEGRVVQLARIQVQGTAGPFADALRRMLRWPRSHRRFRDWPTERRPSMRERHPGAPPLGIDGAAYRRRTLARRGRR